MRVGVQQSRALRAAEQEPLVEQPGVVTLGLCAIRDHVGQWASLDPFADDDHWRGGQHVRNLVLRVALEGRGELSLIVGLVDVVEFLRDPGAQLLEQWFDVKA